MEKDTPERAALAIEKDLSKLSLEEILASLQYSFIRAFNKFIEVLEDKRTPIEVVITYGIRRAIYKIPKDPEIETDTDEPAVAANVWTGIRPTDSVIDKPQEVILQSDTVPNEYLARTNQLLSELKRRYPDGNGKDVFYFFDNLANIFAEIAMAIHQCDPQSGIFPLPRDTAIKLLKDIPLRLFRDPLIFDASIFRDPHIIESKVRDIRFPISRAREALLMAA